MYKIWVTCFGQLQLAFNTHYFRFNNFQYTGKYVQGPEEIPDEFAKQL